MDLLQKLSETVSKLNTEHPEWIMRVNESGFIQRLYSHTWIRICEHGNQRSLCRIPTCKGKSVCDHNMIRSYCKICSKESNGCYCEHKNLRYRCFDCKINVSCYHKFSIRNCRICFSRCFCMHRQIKSKCKSCRDKSVGTCIHDRRKKMYQCVECQMNRRIGQLEILKTVAEESLFS
jgi:hypothetical protein